MGFDDWGAGVQVIFSLNLIETEDPSLSETAPFTFIDLYNQHHDDVIVSYTEYCPLQLC